MKWSWLIIIMNITPEIKEDLQQALIIYKLKKPRSRLVQKFAVNGQNILQIKLKTRN